MSEMRRVVTGHNDKGKSVVLLDGAPVEAGTLFEIWDTDGARVDSHDAADRMQKDVVLSPKAGGSICRYFRVDPVPEGTTREELEAIYAEAFAAIGASHERVDTTRHPGMHKTKTVDYVVLLEGEVTLLLEDDEVALKPFDVVIQRGTNHAWVNCGTAPALLLAVLVDADVAG